MYGFLHVLVSPAVAFPPGEQVAGDEPLALRILLVGDLDHRPENVAAHAMGDGLPAPRLVLLGCGQVTNDVRLGGVVCKEPSYGVPPLKLVRGHQGPEGNGDSPRD